MNTLEAIAKRKSTRKYQSRQIPDSALEEILKAGKSAPYAGAFHISVVQNAELLKRFSDTTLTAMKNSGNEFSMSRASLPGYTPLYGAPTLLVLSAPPELPYSMANTANAATSMTIAATDLELGSCFLASPALGLAADPSLVKEVGIPDGYKFMCAVIVGYSGGDAFSAGRVREIGVNYVR